MMRTIVPGEKRFGLGNNIERDVVVMVTVAVELLVPFSVIEAGEIVQVEADGCPEQVSATT